MKDLPEVIPAMPDIALQEKTQGKNILHAPQGVTTPPVSPSFPTGTGSGGTYVTSGAVANLTAMATSITDIYNALLKEGLIKKK